MATTKSWIKAARPRTLPLALSGIIMGCGLAWFYGALDPLVSVLAVITATLIQVFSNFANDYGDSQKGTDNEFRLGPTRTMQSGEISHSEMKKGMTVVGGLSFIFGIWLVYAGTWHFSHAAFFAFVALGILSLLAAFFYTAGKKSYGYVGLGDLAVFLFFGLLPVIGVFYLNANYWETAIILPAISLGFFSTGVLNLNNMRDIENDQQSGKITLPVRIGARNSRIYHTAMILWGWLSTVLFTFHQQESGWQWLFMLALPLFLVDLKKIGKTKDARSLDPFLKRLSLSTLAFTLLFCLGLILAIS
ncbi:1,4-dihydroxy-2-naphthoate polyprenyltransferase [uncultured Sunxiuqinia sp.]|uniref:1,4-dihydroxy-2-naphthoate polyprenyltransferase n=1 Tax=uncultured Sunxiuqinia sp. TaxID=1573825 RepID=UPI0030D88863